MKKILLTSFIITFSFISSSSASFTDDLKPRQIKPLPLTTPIQMSSAEYAALKRKDYRKLKGEKLSFKEFLFLKISQRWIKKQIRKKGIFDLAILWDKEKKPFKWHWGGFFLGLFLPFIGLLIAGIIKKDDRKWDRINSAAIATAILSAVLIILVFKSIANSL